MALWSAGSEAPPQRRAFWSAESEASNDDKISILHTFVSYSDYNSLRSLRSKYFHANKSKDHVVPRDTENISKIGPRIKPNTTIPERYSNFPASMPETSRRTLFTVDALHA